MKVLITGANGQLGSELVAQLDPKKQVFSMDKNDLNIIDLDLVLKVIKEIKPHVIINAAAYTDVDGCEKNKDIAYSVNAIGARNLAIAAMETNSRLFHISTDFIFDGTTKQPYTEYDQANPLNIYGKSKLLGENFIKDICWRHYIVRTSWLYGNSGHNFVKTMLSLAKEKKSLSVVNDQIGSPTFTKDLVDIIEKLLYTEAYGTYHVSNHGKCSWYEFAKEIFNISGVDIRVNPITSEELVRVAQRPRYSVLDNYMLKLQFGVFMRDWREALEEHLNKNA